LKVKMQTRGLDVFYGEKQALEGVDLEIHANEVTALIGPSGCGKSTYLRCLNRMNDVVPGCRVSGDVTLDGRDIYDPKLDVVKLRARVGMVFQKPNPFPKSIYENVAYGCRVHGIGARAELDEIVERSLVGAGLWDEVKDRLRESALGLSGGQQQRVAIARALINRPSLVFADEPTGNLDSRTSEDVLRMFQQLNEEDGITIILVTHDALVARHARRIIQIYDGVIVDDSSATAAKAPEPPAELTRFAPERGYGR